MRPRPLRLLGHLGGIDCAKCVDGGPPRRGERLGHRFVTRALLQPRRRRPAAGGLLGCGDGAVAGVGSAAGIDARQPRCRPQPAT
jgi:hypothetical protein